MAASSAFKIQCPSCEAMVTIRDDNLVGQKVACPKCKYRFVVEKPDTGEGKKEKADDAGGAKDKKKKKKSAAGLNPKLLIGAGLAGVGLVVLVVVFIAMQGGAGKKPPPNPIGPIVLDGPKGDGDKDEGDKGNGDASKKDNGSGTIKPPVVPPMAGDRAGPELTNLLPSGTQSVFAFQVRNFVESSFGETAFQTAGAFKDEQLKRQLGFSLKRVDALYRADCFKEKERWSFTVVHVTQPIEDLDALTEALGLKGIEPIETQEYFEVTKNQTLLQNLPRLSLGVPPAAAPAGGLGQLFLRLHDKQTLVFGQAVPMTEFLKVKGQLPPWQNKAVVSLGSQPATYVTIAPELRTMLQRLETQPEDAEDKLLFSSALDVRAARQAGLDDPSSRAPWQMRPFWDVSHLLRGRLERVTVLGTALYSLDAQNFSYLSSLECLREDDAKVLERELKEKTAPELAFLQEKLLSHRIELPREKTEILPPKDGAVKPDVQKPEEPTSSHITVEAKNANVTFALNLMLDKEATERLDTAMSILMCGLKGEWDFAEAIRRRYDLAQAGKSLGALGLPARQIPAGQFPPGAFPRPATTQRVSGAPNQRVGWMAGLLPYLGHNTLFSHIDFSHSWKDPTNWLPARTLVPQFLDPSFPDSSRYLLYPGMPFDAAATHYVGLAGIGPEAAEYDPTNPAVAQKLGVFGYDRRSLKEIRSGRGAANTILLIRVPWNGPAGATPWMAGGGSTVRTVPDKDSLEPFLSSEMDGSQRGTYILMVDGSVRYVKKGMKDEVFKALATVKSPLPDGFKLDATAPLVPPPTEPEAAKPELVKPEPPKKDPPKKEEPKKDEGKRDEKKVLNEEEPTAFLMDLEVSLNAVVESRRELAGLLVWSRNGAAA